MIDRPNECINNSFLEQENMRQKEVADWSWKRWEGNDEWTGLKRSFHTSDSASSFHRCHLAAPSVVKHVERFTDRPHHYDHPTYTF